MCINPRLNIVPEHMHHLLLLQSLFLKTVPICFRKWVRTDVSGFGLFTGSVDKTKHIESCLSSLLTIIALNVGSKFHWNFTLEISWRIRHEFIRYIVEVIFSSASAHMQKKVQMQRKNRLHLTSLTLLTAGSEFKDSSNKLCGYTRPKDHDPQALGQLIYQRWHH